MLRKAAFLIVVAVVYAMPTLGQTGQSDSQTLQAILAELRAIHNDVRTTAISQILLTELQTQQTVVNEATQRVSNARLQLTILQADEKRVAASRSREEDRLSQATDASEKKQISEAVDRFKSDLASLKSKDEGLDLNLQEEERQLRSEQDTLDGIQKDLNVTVKRLQPIAETH